MANQQVIHTTKIEARTFVQSPLLIPSAKDQTKFRKLFNGATGEDGDELLEVRIIRTNNTGE